MERPPYIRGKSEALPEVDSEVPGPRPVVLRKHATVLPVTRVHRIEPGRTLLIPAGADEERDAVASAWRSAGGKVQRLGRFWEIPATLEGASVCVYGNVIFSQAIAQQLTLELLGPPDDILLSLPADMRGRSIRASSLAGASELAYPCFAKSMTPKIFTSGVISSADRLLEMTKGLDPDTAILVSEVVRFQAEARAFIYDRRVLDCALYRGRAALEGAVEMAQRIAEMKNLPLGFVADLGLLEEGWVVVELNPAWGSGLNGCDADKVILAIASATRA